VRVKAILRYDGSLFQGYQVQPSHTTTVAGTLQKALHALHITSTIVAAGRTDKDVHATRQVVHFDVPHFWQNLERLKTHINAKIDGITLTHLTATSPHFHARFHAKKRVYRYLFKTTTPHIFEKKYIAYYPSFELSTLKKALTLFEGIHDFYYFHKKGSETKTTVRKIFKCRYRYFKGYHILTFEGNGFLRSQVRMMVDASLACATNQLSLHALKEQIDGKQQHMTTLAPPYGLYLTKVSY
jgi:tRNA pseudouridine38-40 synthase